jgi:hypothetical protein
MVLAAIAPAAATLPAAPAGALPRPLERYLTGFVRLTPVQRQALLAGKPITRLLDSDPAREVAVFGAIWVAADPGAYLDAVRNIEQFERGDNFRITKKISTPPRLEDFARLELPDDDVADLRSCRVGKCALKLSEASLLRLRRQVDFGSPSIDKDVDAFARRLALDYVNGYLAGGNERLAIYRDADNPTFVAREFAHMVNAAPALSAFMPDLKRYLLEFPKVAIPNTESFLYWQEAEFGLKPTIRINHVVLTRQPDHAAVASKMIYASHYFWTALELRVLLPDPARGPGFWFVNVNRSRSDGLSGFVGRLIRGKVRGEAEKGMLSALTATRRTLEDGSATR